MATRDPAPRRKSAAPAPDPRAIAQECLALRARVLNRALTAVYDRALAPHELKVSQFNLLVAIQTHPGVCAAELGGALCIDESTLSRNLERLRARGWLEVEPGEDSRVRSLRLTTSGRSAFEAASRAWVEAQDEATRLLGSTGAAALGRLAGRFLGT